MTKKEETTLYNLTMNPAWQRRVEQFVHREVKHCASFLVSEVAKVEGKIGDMTLDDILPVLLQYDPEDPEADPTEALEHWIVSDWLADRLAEKGQMIMKNFFDFTIWGRTCSGQAISMDHVINEIYYDLVKADLKTDALAKELGLKKGK